MAVFDEIDRPRAAFATRLKLATTLADTGAALSLLAELHTELTRNEKLEMYAPFVSFHRGRVLLWAGRTQEARRSLGEARDQWSALGATRMVELVEETIARL